MNPLRKIWNDTRAIGKNMLMTIVGLVLGLTVAAAILPEAIVDFSNETVWSGAPSSVVTIFTVVVPIVVAISLVVLFLRRR